MSDFLRARSGLLVGVLGAAFGALSFGALAMLSALGALDRVLNGFSLPLTELLVLGVCGPLALLFAYWSYRAYLQWTAWHRIFAQGVSTASAQLLGAESTNARINRRRLHRIRLRLQLPTNQTYDTVCTWFFPAELRERVKDGEWVTVRMDPASQTNVLIDWDVTRQKLGLPAGA